MFTNLADRRFEENSGNRAWLEYGADRPINFQTWLLEKNMNER